MNYPLANLHHHEFTRWIGLRLQFLCLLSEFQKQYLKLDCIHYIIRKNQKWTGILKNAANFMDSAMNNKRIHMGEVVMEMMEPFPIQISHGLVNPFNLTYWGCLYLKK